MAHSLRPGVRPHDEGKETTPQLAIQAIEFVGDLSLASKRCAVGRNAIVTLHTWMRITRNEAPVDTAAKVCSCGSSFVFSRCRRRTAFDCYKSRKRGDTCHQPRHHAMPVKLAKQRNLRIRGDTDDCRSPFGRMIRRKERSSTPACSGPTRTVTIGRRAKPA